MVTLSEEYAMSFRDHAGNFSRNFKDFLLQKQMVDVTLVADGIFIDAHRLILSAVSPYFQQLFTQMPENQRAFVFLTGISIAILEDIITFIYYGEVSVKQENLEEFCKTIKSFGISDTSCEQSKTDSSNATPLTSSYNKGIQYQTSQTFRIQTPGRNILMPTYSGCHSMDNNDSIFMDTYSDRNENQDHNFENGIAENDFGYDVNSMDGSFATSEQWALEYEHFVDGGGDSTEVKPPATKRRRSKDVIDYNIEADIRTNASGRENLFYNGYKYCRNGVHGLRQRWRCTKHSNSKKCGGTVNTMEINGKVMMKVLQAEHSHTF